MLLPGLNAAVDELHCGQTVMPNIIVHGSWYSLRRVYLAQCGANSKRSGARPLAGARHGTCAAAGSGVGEPAVGDLTELCNSKVAKRCQDRDGHHPHTVGARGCGVRNFLGGIVRRGSGDIGLGRRDRRAAGTARRSDRSASNLARRLQKGRQLTMESVLSCERAVGDVDLLHALLGSRALRAVGRKTVRVELPDEPAVTFLHRTPIVPARSEAEGLIPEGDVAVSHRSAFDASLLCERTDQAFRVKRNVIWDSCRNLTRGVKEISAKRESHACQRGNDFQVAELSSTPTLARRGVDAWEANAWSDVMKVI